MSEHTVTVAWKRETAEFTSETYNRDHDWTFDGGVTVRASAPPGYLGNARCIDPEEAFVASLSSCQMLTFLALAAKERYVVDSYRDQAVGVLERVMNFTTARSIPPSAAAIAASAPVSP
jgi:organic hydroperoxide reductase OsmC/OhrA